MEAPYCCGGEHSLLLASANLVLSGPCPCYQRSSFLQGVVCGFSHSHAPLGRWGTAEAGLQLFLKGQEGSCCSSCGCPGTLSWSVLGSKLKFSRYWCSGSDVLSQHNPAGLLLCISGFTLSLTPLRWMCFLGLLLLALVLSLHSISCYCWPSVLSMALSLGRGRPWLWPCRIHTCLLWLLP